MPDGFFAIVTRPPDRPGSRSLSRRDALRPRGPRGVPRGVSSAQGALRGLGGRPARAPALSRRTCRRPRRRAMACSRSSCWSSTIPRPAAVAVDKAIPASAARLHDTLVSAWPRLSGRVSFVEGALEERRAPRGRRGRVEPCLRGADRSRPRSRRRRPGARRGPAVLSRSRGERRRPAHAAGWMRRSPSTSAARSGWSSGAMTSARRRFPPRSRRRTACFWARPSREPIGGSFAHIAAGCYECPTSPSSPRLRVSPLVRAPPSDPRLLRRSRNGEALLVLPGFGYGSAGRRGVPIARAPMAAARAWICTCRPS